MFLMAKLVAFKHSQCDGKANTMTSHINSNSNSKNKIQKVTNKVVTRQMSLNAKVGGEKGRGLTAVAAGRRGDNNKRLETTRMDTTRLLLQRIGGFVSKIH